MISVDSSVWIEFLRDTPSAENLLLSRMIEKNAAIALSPVVLMEVLRGVQDEDHAAQAEEMLLEFDPLSLSVPGDFLLAASLYRTACRSGISIRSSVDCLIAASCVRTGTPLLHRDADFDRLASCTPLRVHRA